MRLRWSTYFGAAADVLRAVGDCGDDGRNLGRIKLFMMLSAAALHSDERLEFTRSMLQLEYVDAVVGRMLAHLDVYSDDVQLIADQRALFNRVMSPLLESLKRAGDFSVWDHKCSIIMSDGATVPMCRRALFAKRMLSPMVIHSIGYVDVESNELENKCGAPSHDWSRYCSGI
ncbi:hypothetical protein HDU98_005194 [Podochytrium sp. JEL0797]|nr:hypothetical protein HDU98_005194 [Podochytrium sp. JEL0797]